MAITLAILLAAWLPGTRVALWFPTLKPMQNEALGVFSSLITVFMLLYESLSKRVR